MNWTNLLCGIDQNRTLAAAGAGTAAGTARRGRSARAARTAVEALEARALFAATTETFTGGKGPFNTTFEYWDNALIPRGVSDGSETLQLTSGASFQALDFKVRHNGGAGNVSRMRLVGYNAANEIIYDNQFNTPANTTVTIPVNTTVKKLEFQPITVISNGNQFVGTGVLRTVLDDFRYDPQVAANSPPQLTGMGAGQLWSFSENGQLSIFANPSYGINAAVQDSDNDTLTVDVLADDPARGLLIGLDQDGDGKYFSPVAGQPGRLRLVGTPAQITRAIRDVYLYFANVDDVTDTGRTYTTTFTVLMDDGHNPVVSHNAQGILHGVNEAPSVGSSAAAATLLNQFTWDRDTITPFTSFTVDDPDNKPVLPVDDVPPDLLWTEVRFSDANGALVGTGWNKVLVEAGTATWRYAGNYLQATAAIRAVQFNPTDKFVPGGVTTTNFNVRVADFGFSTTFAGAVSVAAKTNTSPVLSGGQITRASIVEGADGAPVTVASLVAAPNAMTDVDPGQRRGVAVVGAAGSWQYTADNGASWTNFGAVSPSSALVLSDTSQVRYVGGDANGQLSFTYKAWDRSSWLANVGGTASSAAARVLVDAGGFSAPPQNVSPFSLATMPNTQPVTPVNDAPNIVNGSKATLTAVAEDAANPAGQTVSAVFAGFFSDADDNQTATGGSAANNFAGVAVVANAATAAAGTWQYATGAAAAWVNLPTTVSNTAALLLGPDARIRFLPAANFNGTVPALTVRLVDDSGGALAGGTTADVSVNGDPTRYSAATMTAGLTVTPVNDAPAVVDGATAALPAVAEDTANPTGTTMSTLFAGRFSDASDQVAGGSVANGFAGVVITGNAASPAQGAWQYFTGSGAWISLGAVTPSVALGLSPSAQLRFLPGQNYNGAAGALTVHLVDDSGGPLLAGALVNAAATGGTTRFSAAVALGQTVTEVNDMPAPGSDVLSAIAEDSGDRLIPFSALVGNDLRGPANESAQALIVETVSGAVGGSVRIDGTNVVFTPDANFNGPASFIYTVEDNGTTNGAAAPRASDGFGTVSFTVTPVNDAPTVASLAAGPDAVTRPAPVTLTAAGVADVEGAANVAEVVFFRETNGTPGLQTGPGGDLRLGADANPADGYTLAAVTDGVVAGTHTYYARAADAAGAVSNVVSATHTLLPPPAPRVRAVYVNSTAWSAEFYAYLVQNNLGDARGFRVSAGAPQLVTVPWSNVNQVNVAFDQDVDVVQGDLQVRGADVADYAFGTFAYDAAARTARWTLTPAVGGSAVLADRLQLELVGGAVTGVGAAALEALDGEWADGAGAFPSGDGAAGGAFRFGVNVLPGDADRAGNRVGATDVGMVRSRQNRTSGEVPPAGLAPYSPFADLDGSGRINAADVGAVRARQNDTLPAPAAVASLATASLADDLFGSKPILA